MTKRKLEIPGELPVTPVEQRKPYQFHLWLNAAMDWAERNDVPLRIWRDEMADWWATIELKDSEGWFRHAIPVRGDPEKALIKAVIVMRRERMRELNGVRG